MKLLLFICLSLNLYSDVALVSIKDLTYKEVVDFDNFQEINLDKKIYCKKFDRMKLLEEEYIAKRYILKNTPICEKDLIVAPNHRVKFNFGNIIIERSGEFVGETDSYIKLKKSDGTIEKIQKNGM